VYCIAEETAREPEIATAFAVSSASATDEAIAPISTHTATVKRAKACATGRRSVERTVMKVSRATKRGLEWRLGKTRSGAATKKGAARDATPLRFYTS
jgi:hypothetical protein